MRKFKKGRLLPNSRSSLILLASKNALESIVVIPLKASERIFKEEIPANASFLMCLSCLLFSMPKVSMYEYWKAQSFISATHPLMIIFLAWILLKFETLHEELRQGPTNDRPQQPIVNKSKRLLKLNELACIMVIGFLFKYSVLRYRPPWRLSGVISLTKLSHRLSSDMFAFFGNSTLLMLFTLTQLISLLIFLVKLLHIGIVLLPRLL